MPTEKKVKIVEELQETFSRASIGILTDYRGLTTTELNDLRRKLRDVKVEYKIIKTPSRSSRRKTPAWNTRRTLLKARWRWLSATARCPMPLKP
jgi:hypothetical protein